MERDWRPGGVIQHQHPAQCSIQTKHCTIILYSLDKYGWAWAQVILGGNPRLVRGGDDMVRVWR